ncbi:heme/hemopexin-binding protein HxuC [Haemophilus influenzae]|uniref:heme/hemopexin-binding protein HxuC n=1 Tax=Haemophilus influenzae TaxID=727 RepID=UPI000A0CB8A3|nr:heme/hemopexin-binding protein HxuC [Haemophilus influenzae]ORJ41406.1 ligand-gated channel [Haemophilus influenzae]PRI74353.1 Heme/hemopexin utilization protein C precursor [Haemophilus influenzae]PRI84531.1 Heme/hemopexin utilization protein C precursor [Haemophilus influenzae]PRL91265.1 Heme/hemopexin utilization protein C precursor [Haemophilus influenzae]PRM04133.1 Heme/hemopexin utilization protein C precursor [Haemophilus influenzae]
MRFSKLSLAITTTLVTANALAQSVELDSINVIATRDPSRFAYTPEKQSKDSLLSKQATSVADALEDIPNVDVRGGSRSIAQKPNIRGLSDNRVVQVIDGVRQNFDLAHRGSYFLPMSLIQEIEVIKGPSSSLWGSGALGGVVAMRTPNALDLLKNNDKFGVKIRQGYQTANNLSERDVSVFAANDKFDVLISGFYNNADNLRTGKGNKLNNTAYKQFGGLAKFGWQINDANRVELSHRETRFKQTAPSNNEVENELTNEQITDQIKEYHNPSNSSPPKTKPSTSLEEFYSGVKTRLGSVSYLTDQQIPDQSTVFNYYLTPDNPYLNTHIALYNNKTIEKEQRKVSDVKDQTKLTTRGINLRNSSELSHISFVYGVDYMRDKIRTERGTNSNDAKFRAEPYNANSNTTGVYLIAHIPLFGEKLLVSPSVRYDHYDTSSKTVKYKDNHLSPATKLTWIVTNWLDFTAKYNEAFRAPSMQERFVSGAHFGARLGGGREEINKFIANPNLRPETAKNKEITANLHFDSLFKQGDKFKIEATYFRNDVKDFINLKIFNDAKTNTNGALLPKNSQYQNITNARLSGIELQAQYQTERLTLFTNYGSTKGKDKDSGEALSNIAASKIGVGVNYALVKDKFTVGTTVTHYAAQRRVPKDHGVTYPSYILTDLRATYAPLKGEWKNLRLDFALENLFDRKYQPAFSLMEGTGRNAKISAVYSF